MLPGATNTKNPLLIKDVEGQVKQSHYDLPPAEHTYGKKVVDDPLPINHVTSAWDYSQKSEMKLPQNNKDFRELNKMTVKTGLHTAKQQTGFRQTHHVPLKTKVGSKFIPVYLPEEDFTYGQANRPSTPVKLVVGNCYALMAEDKNRETYQTRASKSLKNTKKSFKDTKNHDLLKEKNRKLIEFHNKPNKEEKFQMTRFKNETNKVNTNLQSFGLTSSKIQS